MFVFVFSFCFFCFHSLYLVLLLACECIDGVRLGGVLLKHHDSFTCP